MLEARLALQPNRQIGQWQSKQLLITRSPGSSVEVQDIGRDHVLLHIIV